MEKIIRLGLIGKPISHSKSPDIFAGFFSGEAISDAQYQLFELNHIGELPQLIAQNPLLGGFNVTIPYKKEIFQYLHAIDPKAQAIGAVNTVKIIRNSTDASNTHPPKNDARNMEYGIESTNEPGSIVESKIESNVQLIGYNTDFDGFEFALKSLPCQQFEYAYILGTGGSSKAVAAVLTNCQIPCKKVSRDLKEGNNSINQSFRASSEQNCTTKEIKGIFEEFSNSVFNIRTINYEEFLNSEFQENTLIINTTPLGMWPDVESCSPIPWNRLPQSTQFIDLVYNPQETQLLKEAKMRGLKGINGLSMLQTQAEKAWEIFKK
jgi:shikimate dehydrogenase